ncbi:MAG TPA: AAA family ATPase [Accumulibacter sp.]|uniref:ATP-dependent nuclease n=1 Tax=Accumulibacter sp. TaxID=2053492 RepID=UPI0025CF67A4|nr:AAA family ATPase [Accumulibacter sp.]MCM8598070.1 ATP-binding protein [Accumulibacter sp.]MCM8662014.1 ATP-binding protein [Accumulibacter sp.]HNC51409.1 AAA family ATPase [Accumulibacter sp.]
MLRSEIRESTKQELLKKVREHDYGKYLLKASILKIRGFSEEDITFEFPVTALIGPNGGGKSSVLGVAGCAYKDIKPGLFFPKSAVGDESMSGWRIEYELIDKTLNPKQLTKRSSNFRQAKWVRGDVVIREVLFFGIERTVPAGEKARYKRLMRSTYVHKPPLEAIDSTVAKQVEHILGKPVSNYQVTDYGSDDKFLVGKSDGNKFSEFHFGAGESSIIRMVTKIEQAPQNSLILIEEIENGLHPIATKRMVEYLIDVASRKSLQAIFTTHSDYALSPLPNEAIWASISGKLRQGKLSVEALRAVSGRVDKKLAIFVEDEFAKTWVDAILREKLGASYDQVEVHAVHGDGNAVKTHNGHLLNPAINFKSLCVIDGDSKQDDKPEDGIYRLPGSQPELTVFESVRNNLDENIAILTVSCQRAPDAQARVKNVIESISRTNRDPHVIFSQVGIEIGFVAEAIVRGAFLALWIRANTDFCDVFSNAVRKKIGA